MTSEQERVALAAMTRVGEPDDARLRRAVRELGAVEVWLRLRRGEESLAGERLSDLLPRAREANPERDLERLRRLGGRLVCPDDPEWPTRLDMLPAAGSFVPFALWAKGSRRLAAATARSVAIVGARSATAYGVRMATDLAAGVADSGFTVVSGGAYGIDGAAHRGAISVGGDTVVVLACGIDVAYPSGHGALFEAAATSGVVLSEAPPGAAAMRHRFLTRNRIIAGLGLGTVVVEAAVRSGATSTANHAERLMRPVMAVPGPVGSPTSAGCHLLIRERGAILVTSPAEIIDAVGAIGDDLAPMPRGPARPLDQLGEQARRVFDAVPVRRGVAAVRIAVTAGLDPRQTTGRLAELAARGLVERCDGGWRLAASARAGADDGALP